MFKKLRDMLNHDKATQEEQADIADINPVEALGLTGEAAEFLTGVPAAEQNDSTEPDAQQQIAELKDKYIRLYAEFDNYKRRSVKEKLDWMKSAAQDTLSALLPVLDDFDRARRFGATDGGSGLSEGVELVYQKLYNTVRQKGLEPMESTGLPFDPELHDAITEIPAPNDEMRGKVMDTVEKGYKLNDKIIRHAKVVVGK